jgi:hypothetical protein
VAFHEGEEELLRGAVAVLFEAEHGRAVAGHVAVASELSTHWATLGGVVGEEAGVVHAPYEFLLESKLDFGECRVFFVEG